MIALDSRSVTILRARQFSARFARSLSLASFFWPVTTNAKKQTMKKTRACTFSVLPVLGLPHVSTVSAFSTNDRAARRNRRRRWSRRVNGRGGTRIILKLRPACPFEFAGWPRPRNNLWRAALSTRELSANGGRSVKSTRAASFISIRIRATWSRGWMVVSLTGLNLFDDNGIRVWGERNKLSP